jgi:hypothetical protein
MLELSESNPAVVVPRAEYFRLLGLPRDFEPTGRVLELADWARQWYGDHGKPWWYARQIEQVAVDGGEVRVEGVRFGSSRLRETLGTTQARSVILVAASAGDECERHARELWDDGKPDEYFFLEVFGSAVVETLVTVASYRLCAWADEAGLTVLPHDSPGYPGWDVAEQGRLLERIAAGAAFAFGDRLDVLDSGMLRPKKSLLAVFGVADHRWQERSAAKFIPCERCALRRCRYRRAPYRRPLPRTDGLPPHPNAHAAGR